MATTIRKNIFETNSSSSHSLSIEKVEEKDIEIIDGILNINDLEKFNFDFNSWNDESIITCDTRNKKLALAFSMMINDYNDDYESEYHELLVNKFNNLAEKYNVKVIGEYSVWDEQNDIDRLIDIIDDDSYVVRSIYQSN